jgi:hypothetical protein
VCREVVGGARLEPGTVNVIWPVRMIFKSVPTDHSLIIEGVFLNAYKGADCDAEVGCNQLSFDGVAMLDVGCWIFVSAQYFHWCYLIATGHCSGYMDLY